MLKIPTAAFPFLVAFLIGLTTGVGIGYACGSFVSYYHHQ